MKRPTPRLAFAVTLAAAAACSNDDDPASPGDARQAGVDASTRLDGTAPDGGTATETGPGEATRDAAFVCTSTPLGGAQPSGTLGAGFRAPTLTTTTTEVNNGFARVQVTKDSSNYYRADLQLVFTDYVACGYAKADLAKENHLFGDIVMWRNQSGTPPAPFTAGSYKSSLDPQADAGAPAEARPISRRSRARLTSRSAITRLVI